LRCALKLHTIEASIDAGLVMRSTVTVEEPLVAELVALTGARSKTAAVKRALEEQIRLAKLRRLSDLLGHVEVDEAALTSGDAADLARSTSLRGEP